MSDKPDPDAIVPLQQWLKLLAEQGVPMRTAMQFAAKAYKEHNTPAKLGAINSQKLTTLVPDKDTRKLLAGALKGISLGAKPTTKQRDRLTSHTTSGSASISGGRSSGRDSDLLRPLGDGSAPTNLPTSYEFHEITHVESLLPVNVTVNRAPVKTAWCYAVARRMGFDVEEALSIAHVYVHISSLKHALGLGNILNTQQTREAEEEIRELPGEADFRRPAAGNSRDDWRSRRRGVVVEKAVGSSQPWVGILRAKPVIERPDGTWRAIQKGAVVEPSQAFLYITRALKDYTPHVMGALQLVAQSYTAQELEVVGLPLYNEFKPDVVEWGQRGSVSIATILEQVKGPVDEDGSGEGSGSGAEAVAEPAEPPTPIEEPNVSFTPVTGTKRAASPTAAAAPETPSKKSRDMTVEEYEAMLDAEDAALFNLV